MRMEGSSIRVVNIIPAVKLKKPVLKDEEEVNYACKKCNKRFVTEIAVTNHVRMEHFDTYLNTKPADWMEKVVLKDDLEKKKEHQKMLIKKKTDELISSMKPTSLMALTSKDVSYIIIKAENSGEEELPKKKTKISKKAERAVKIAMKREEKKKPITGPFECLHPSTRYEDGFCRQMFESCCDYSRHYRDEHTRRRKALRCQVCEKPLDPDAEIEGNTNLYACHICNTAFATNKELAHHMDTIHVKLKPYMCSICHKRFSQQCGVQQHMRMHTGVRPFACTYCNKTFTQKSGLDQHTRIHTKVKPYRCIICERAFCQSIHLKQHMRTHTNVTPFQCVICLKSFKQRSHLDYHLRAHNEANMTESQKKNYAELIGMIEGDQVVEVEIDEQVDMREVIEVDEIVMEETEEDQNFEEQTIAESSIIDDGSYILGTV